MNKKVKVVSLVSQRVVLTVPDIRLRRVWERKGATMVIPFEQLEEAMYSPGVENLFRNGILGIDDMEVKIALGLEPEDAEEPVNIITLNDQQRKRYLTVMPLPEFKENMKKLSAIAVTDWLVSKGYLSLSVKDNGHTTKIPTSLGENLGITSIIKEGKKGPYLVNVYNVSAQRFIIDNIEEISLSIQK